MKEKCILFFVLICAVLSATYSIQVVMIFLKENRDIFVRYCM